MDNNGERETAENESVNLNRKHMASDEAKKE